MRLFENRFLRRWHWRTAVIEAAVWLALSVVLIKLLPFRWLVVFDGAVLGVRMLPRFWFRSVCPRTT